MRVEQEAALFRQVSRGPLDRENVKSPEPAPPLAFSCEGEDDTQVFLPFTGRTRSTLWRQFDVEQRGDTCFASTLLPHRAPVSPPPQAIRAASAQHWWDEFQCLNSAE